MPVLFFPLLAKFLAMVVAGLVFRALAAIGFGYLSYVGIGSLVDSAGDYIRSLFAELPSQVLAIMGLGKVDVAINIVLSAIIARLLLAGMDKVTGTITSIALLNKAGG